VWLSARTHAQPAPSTTTTLTWVQSPETAAKTEKIQNKEKNNYGSLVVYGKSNRLKKRQNFPEQKAKPPPPG
jgi:hypothetical protein